MLRTQYPGGFYGDALPTGERAILYPNDRIETHLGRVNFPAGEVFGPTFLKVSNVGGFHFAGLAHEKLLTIREWRAGTWTELPAVFGRFVYDRDGKVRDGLPNGYQFVADDGRLVTRGEAYGPTHGLSEWTQSAELFIGQGHGQTGPIDGGVVIYDGKDYRLLESGLCTFINVHHLGEQVTIVFVKSGVGVVVIDTTLSELRGLPIYKAASIPLPTKPPIPSPENPKPVATPNRLDIVKVVASQHPELVKLNTAVACGKLTEYIGLALHAADPGWGLLSKSPGENQYRGHGVDSIIYQPTQQVIDLMSGGGDRDLLRPDSTPDQRKAFDHDIRIKWDEVGKRANNNWMAPIQPEGEVEPPPVPSPVPPTAPSAQVPAVDLTPLQNELAALAARNALLEARVQTLESKPAAKSGDAVEVTGAISIGDAWASRKVTWTGKIK